MSALFGYQPEFDVAENETLYGAIRYDSALGVHCPRSFGPLIFPT